METERTDEWPPHAARTMEDWDAYWSRQRWDRRWRHNTLSPFLARTKRKLLIPRGWYRQARWFIQRGQHGYARTDLWSMDDYICTLLGQMTADLKARSHGYPCNCDHGPGEDGIWRAPDSCTCEQDYADTLDKISAPLIAYKTRWDWPDGTGRENYEAHRERSVKLLAEAQDALRLMAENLPALWD